ncbi:hypothetical protein G6162_003963 [Salmonella enterica]|nr:hypothetical protein [Salmonella enterica]EAT8890073.1 hypothetical protein [Salmonella enterica subsp. arizonae serovar 53:z4,z23,z32:-]EDW1853751.1 hypothetical protein [Salmonella enterica subsp. diarizonae]EDX6773848.1 hypothetical protein [Salmonella enterica subsp. arizonae serovar 53:z4,z24:-]HAU2703813.1 hypothetical protein [Salmonella enterica subsp. arizonae]
MSYLYLLFSGISLTSKLGVIVFWLSIPVIFFYCFGVSLLYNRKVHKKYFIMVIWSVFFILMAGLSGYFLDDFNSRVISNVYLSLVGLFMALVFYNRGNSSNDKSFITAIKITISINLCAFYIQFVSFYLFHYIIDYNLLSGGLGGRFYWGDLFRAAGFFDEPAVYSLHMVALTVMLYMQERKFSILIIVTLLSLLLSFSFIAIFQAMILSLLFIKNKRGLLVPLVVCLVVALLFKDNIYERYLQFVSGGDGSNNTKLDTIYNLFQGVKWLYGYGLVGYSQSFPLYYQGLYDLTFWGANISLYGIVLGLIINVTVLFFLLKFTMRDFLLINIVLLKLSTPTYGIYFCFLFFLLWYKQNMVIRDAKNISFNGDK